MKKVSHFEFTGSFIKGYDRFNHLATLGLDHYWRRHTAKRVGRLLRESGGPTKVLDLACGTGDMAAAVCRQHTGVTVFGADPSMDMLRIAEQKRKRREWNRIFPICAVGELPFGRNSIQGITCAFGVRNFVYLEKDLRECIELLRPGGRLYLLDFFQPEHLLSNLFLVMYKKIVAPILGFVVTGQIQPYRYLMNSMYAFRTPAAMMALLQQLGCRPVEIKPFFFNLVHLVVAEKTNQ